MMLIDHLNYVITSYRMLSYNSAQSSLSVNKQLKISNKYLFIKFLIIFKEKVFILKMFILIFKTKLLNF